MERLTRAESPLVERRPVKPRKARAVMSAKEEDQFERLYVSLRDGNSALKVEVEFLRVKGRELTILLQKVNRAIQKKCFDRMGHELLTS
jgi:hypothetical protein